MREGDLVRLSAYGGEEIVRRVVLVKGDHVGVCKQQEFDRAKAEGRAPLVVGFPTADVLGVVQSSGA